MAEHRFRLRLIHLLLAIPVLAVCFVVLLPRPEVTRANYDRIKVGMALEEVQNLFGKEGGVFHGFPNKSPFTYYWQNEDGAHAIILFDDKRRVMEKAVWEDSTKR